jgi:hypothetical protein
MEVAGITVYLQFPVSIQLMDPAMLLTHIISSYALDGQCC